ncbi:DUF1493 family protein [Mucilaginibacter sp. Bleaf8]|uniref:DUF1493 family protein n=1 Tax=Mucilaginibacter sp. Bleaf8 TaxID=2834430 RepID=UPI001BD0B844|nr:DUF1493 family protein [Mucilaginibacter sp. Bleaf8]MBS7565761.1 DUF1493 family protein [Mucilaginibacter sp. Bleaf8]
MQYKELPFMQLRQAYTTVKRFLEDQAACDVHSLHDKVGDDLGLAGDDVEDLLVKFVEQHHLAWGNFDFSKHFDSEGEIFASSYELYNLAVMVIKVVLWLIEMLSFKQIQFNNKPDWYRQSDGKESDLTFKQMLTWYIEKDFTAVEQISYKLAMSRPL